MIAPPTEATVVRDLSPSQKAARTLLIGGAALVVAYCALSPLLSVGALVFCAILFAIAISTVADWIHRRTRLPYRVAVIAVMLLLGAATAGFIAWTGPQLAAQLDEVADRVPRGLEAAERWLHRSDFGRTVQEGIPSMPDAMTSSSREVFGSVQRGVISGVTALASATVVIVLGMFLAISPHRYVRGALRLIPERHREEGRVVVGRIGRALRAWLLARLVLMAVIGLLFGIGLRILGVPLAFPLGVIAGLLSFIPYVGPMLSVIPAAAIGLLESPQLALYVLLLYLGVQFLESNVIEPIVEARAVELPPALLIVAQIASAVWFGPIGVLFATPLFVVFVVALRALYLERQDAKEQRSKRAERETPPMFAATTLQPRDAE